MGWMPVVVPPSVTPTGWGIGQKGDMLAILSGCCEAALYSTTGEGKNTMQCAGCTKRAEGPEGCHTDRERVYWQNVNAPYIVEWVAAWTGVDLHEITVTIEYVEEEE